MVHAADHPLFILRYWKKGCPNSLSMTAHFLVCAGLCFLWWRTVLPTPLLEQWG